MGVLLTVICFILGLGISYGISVGLMYLVCLCFSWEFNLLIATGIWLLGVLFKGLFSRDGKE